MSEADASAPMDPAMPDPAVVQAMMEQMRQLAHYDWTGGNLNLILYGITLILFVRSIRGLLFPRHGRGQNWTLAVYVVTIFSAVTIYMSINMSITQEAYINHADFPEGGSQGWAFSQQQQAKGITSNACFIISNWLADALLLYRSKVIFEANLLVIILPVLVYLASIATGILTLHQAAQPNSSLWANITVDIALTYFSIAVTLNVLLTLIISAHLLWHQKQITKMTGRGDNLPYTTVVIMLVESASLYAIFSLIFIGTYAAQHPSSAMFLQILGQIQVIAPLLIIARVTSNKGFTTSISSVPESSYGYSNGSRNSTGRAHGHAKNMSIERKPQFAAFTSTSDQTESYV